MAVKRKKLVLHMRHCASLHDRFDESRSFIDKAIIGRNEDCDWCISSPDISRQHVHFFIENNVWYVMDLSVNGVYIGNNEEPLGKNNQIVINEGDKINIGEWTFVVDFEEIIPRELDNSLYEPVQTYFAHKEIDTPTKQIDSTHADNPFFEEIHPFDKTFAKTNNKINANDRNTQVNIPINTNTLLKETVLNIPIEPIECLPKEIETYIENKDEVETQVLKIVNEMKPEYTEEKIVHILENVKPEIDNSVIHKIFLNIEFPFF